MKVSAPCAPLNATTLSGRASLLISKNGTPSIALSCLFSVTFALICTQHWTGKGQHCHMWHECDGMAYLGREGGIAEVCSGFVAAQPARLRYAHKLINSMHVLQANTAATAEKPRVSDNPDCWVSMITFSSSKYAWNTASITSSCGA